MDKNDVIKNIRSTLISVKGPFDIKSLQRDYTEIVGKSIPFKNFGFNTLEEFLKSCPTLKVSKGSNGQILVDAVPTEKSSHISDLVQKQKTSKKASKKTRLVFTLNILLLLV